MKTKYGNASFNKQGHLRITSRVEGNKGKLLFEDMGDSYDKVCM